ncbi:hypothetical protein B0H17DRAFT_1198948 [Mycena rosella]|uniref:F-box domain-containing protein n=1 Tax=Mycena rosella TaxID=1033263 RepID=A0AAD7DLW8_MYCRO|nr:hypothetical protein B0H17DRAFT_1198948 [Mycena rosella]
MQSSKFHDLSTEIKYAIAYACSPLDLVKFLRMNRQCRRIADLLRCSIVKIGGPTLDLPASLLPGVIVFFFGTSLCWTCGKQTDTYPLSFSLCIWVCNDQCKEDLYNRSSKLADRFATIPSRAELKGDNVLLEYIESWAPFLERSVNGRKVYSSQQLRAAISLLSNTIEVVASKNAGQHSPNARSLLLEEWSQRASDLPVLQICANRMIAWRKTYEKDRKKCSTSNDRIVKTISTYYYGLKLKSLRRSPTLLRTLDLYNKDLDAFTFTAFSGIRIAVHAELRDLESAAPRRVSRGTENAPRIAVGEFLPCPLSIKKYGAEGLAMYNAAKHQ